MRRRARRPASRSPPACSARRSSQIAAPTFPCFPSPALRLRSAGWLPARALRSGFRSARQRRHCPAGCCTAGRTPRGRSSFRTGRPAPCSGSSGPSRPTPSLSGRTGSFRPASSSAPSRRSAAGWPCPRTGPCSRCSPPPAAPVPPAPEASSCSRGSAKSPRCPRCCRTGCRCSAPRWCSGQRAAGCNCPPGPSSRRRAQGSSR